MTRDLGLIWNPRWYWQGASLWMLAAKTAFAAAIRVEAALQRLLGLPQVPRTFVWAPPQARLQHACEALKLDASVAASLAFEPDCTGLEGRQHLSLALRWCPACLGRWFHSPLFQDLRVRHCPWHGERLLDSCPACGRAVDPLGMSWRCGFCSKRLVEDPPFWLAGLKLPPGHSGELPTIVPADLFGYRETAQGVLCYADPDGERHVSRLQHGLLFWQEAQLWESAAALWDTVLASHHTCEAHETFGYGRQYHRVVFRCPVIAAARAVFWELGVQGVMTGDWPDKQMSGTGYRWLPAPETVSLEVRRAVLRELPRAWLADAALLFGEAARAGRDKARWEAHPDAFVSKTTLTSGLNGPETVTKRPVRWLEAAMAFSGQHCPNGKTQPPSKADFRALLGLL